MFRTLIIDDEPLAREEMHRLLGEQTAVTIVGEADDVPSAQKRLAIHDYDLVFLDIDLGGGSGFDLVSHVRPGARIIFATAHNEFALRAFEINALDYLLKPIAAARLTESIARLVGEPVAAPVDVSEPSLPPLADTDRVLLKNDRGVRFVPLGDLVAIVSSDNYTDVAVADGSHFLVRRPLSAWEEALSGDSFLRVHRQAIINLDQIERMDSPPGGQLTLQMRGMNEPVLCSHRRAAELRRQVGSSEHRVAGSE
ncbi:MAG: LytTR family DNA-binding domain-containing protein [Synoicihabitans sp.]